MTNTTGTPNPLEGEAVYVKEDGRTTVGHIESVDTDSQEVIVSYDRGRSEAKFEVETENEGFPTLERKVWRNGGAEVTPNP